MWNVVEKVEPGLSFARARLRDGSGPGSIQAVLDACTVYLDLYRPPECQTYKPAAVIRARCEEWTDEAHQFNIEPVHECVGDTSQVLECLQVLIQGSVLEQDAALVTELFERENTPCIALSFEGPGRFPDPIVIHGVLSIPRDELSARWTAATRGGRIEPLPNGLLLRLTGARMVPEPTSEHEPLRETVEAARHACAAGDPELFKAIDTALAVADGSCPPAPADLRTIVEEVMAEDHPALTRASIVPENIIASGIPPIRVHRLRFRAFVSNAAKYAVTALPEGGRLTVLFEYNAAQQAVDCVISAEGKTWAGGDPCLAASLRRAMVEVHNGAFELVEGPRGATISASIPDIVGQQVAEWIPGFEIFSDRSRQVLRLLKSGGEALPEDLLLSGVLEEELERWLLPRLTDAPATNLAHDAVPDNRRLVGSSSERLKKALEQIRRGKVRKEITKPAYAAEILYAFRSEDRHRKAIGAERLNVAEIETLCASLLQTPPDFVACLRLVARARKA